MLHKLQDKIEIELPPAYKDMPNAYNTEWNEKNGQAYEMKNFIELSANRKTLFDVGGNVGFFSYVFVCNENKDNTKESFLFEPSPFGMEICVNVLNHNKWHDRIKLFPYFVGADCGEVEFLLEADAGTFLVMFDNIEYDHMIVNKETHKPQTKEVLSIDRFVEKYAEEMGKPTTLDAIKIDVEGYEFKVLTGANKTLTEIKPLIFLEVHGHLIGTYNDSVVDVYTMMKGLDYQMFDLHMNEITTRKQYETLFDGILEIRVVCKHIEDKF
tara:strand:- start:227 stop:1033 length:807 start_codon:yes stop_codon:yes gene_type:complete